MLRRHFAHVVMSAEPAEGALRPFLLALLAIMVVPNAAHACAMYFPIEEVELVAEAPSLEAVFADIDAAAPAEVPEPSAGLDEQVMQLLLDAEPQVEVAPEPTADAQPQS